jgi:DNA-directed RNA polymerase specialized sigma24 family protein
VDDDRGSTSTQRIADAFAELLPEHREVITRAHRGASVTELADALSVSEDIVKSRLHHGLRAFRSALQKNGVTVP